MDDKPTHSFVQQLRQLQPQRDEVKARVATVAARKPKEALALLCAERHFNEFLDNSAISDGKRNEALAKIIDKIVPHELEGGGWAYKATFGSAI
ncbi:MAG: hypothetical protein ACRYFS_00680 [Janthinobacterium lividum]